MDFEVVVPNAVGGKTSRRQEEGKHGKASRSYLPKDSSSEVSLFVRKRSRAV